MKSCCNIRTGTGNYPYRFHVGDFLPSEDTSPWWGILPRAQDIIAPPSYTVSYGIGRSNCHIESDAHTHSIELLVPGLSKNDIEITLQDYTLTVEYKPRDNGFHFNTKPGKETFTIPKDCDLDTTTSHIVDGILEIVIDKMWSSTEQPTIRKIDIN